MPLGPAIGALIAGSANNVMPAMTPKNDFNAKSVNVRLMMLRPQFAKSRTVNEPMALMFLHSQKRVAER